MVHGISKLRWSSELPPGHSAITRVIRVTIGVSLSSFNHIKGCSSWYQKDGNLFLWYGIEMKLVDCRVKIVVRFCDDRENRLCQKRHLFWRETPLYLNIHFHYSFLACSLRSIILTLIFFMPNRNFLYSYKNIKNKIKIKK